MASSEHSQQGWPDLKAAQHTAQIKKEGKEKGPQNQNTAFFFVCS